MSKLLNRSFYSRDSSIVAKELLGKLIVRHFNNNILIGKIVETESYLPENDPASHSFIGKTTRNSVLFNDAGFCYVFSIHRYFCFNTVCNSVNIPGGVLIRALEPVQGIDLMENLRDNYSVKNLTNGPGKLCKALNITREQNNIDLTKKESEIYILDAPKISEELIVTTTRIGISKAAELPLRFYIKGNPFVSKF